MLPLGLCAQLACIWEVTARKAGNVHRYCDFADMKYLDFLASAAAIAPVMERAPHRLTIGETVLEAIEATRRVVSCNTNLGIVLLLAPLVTVREVAQTTVDDSKLVYRAIRLAQPGNLGAVGEQDIATEPTLPLHEVMALAAARDLIARQYGNGFAEVFHCGLPAFQQALQAGQTIEGAILACQLELLARHPDSLIARKRGAELANDVSRRAAAVLAAGWKEGNGDRAAFGGFDAWLRAERLNLGTTADLVTATLFLALRCEAVAPGQPFDLPGAPGTIT